MLLRLLLSGPSVTATTVVACGLPGPHHHSVSCPLTAVGSPVPLHPGAIRYYKEKGLIR